MIILHTAETDNQLFLWGEVSFDGSLPVEPLRKRWRKPATPVTPPHPHDAGPDRLMPILVEFLPGCPDQGERLQPLQAWLPSLDKSPIPSSPLIAESPTTKTRPMIRPWTVTAFPMSAEDNLSLLLACVDRTALSPGLLIGHDLAFWVQALRFAGALVARQRYLPGITPDENGPRGGWDPIFIGADAERLKQLAGTMPGSARALSGPEAVAPPDRPAMDSLSAFLRRMVNALVVASLGRHAAILEIERRIGRRPRPSDASMHDQWLNTLETHKRTLSVDAAELRLLSQQILEWRRKLTLFHGSPYRLCLRLEEPENRDESIAPSEQGWLVRFLLQAVDDPSLLIPLQDVWQARKPLTKILNRQHFNPAEYLLFALGQAARLYPRMESGLKTSRPIGLALDDSDAYSFLTAHAPALEEAGFGIMLPAWWTSKGTKQRLRAGVRVNSPKMTPGARLSLSEILRFELEVALGDERLTIGELRELIKLKSPLVKLRGQWVEISGDEIKAVLEFWKKKRGGTASAGEIVRMAMGGAELVPGIVHDGVRADGWMGGLLDQLAGREDFECRRPPAGLVGQLRPYQVRGYSWLNFLTRYGLGACLADDMGLGKTVQSLAFIQQYREAGGDKPVLLICPTSVINNWLKEAEAFTPDLSVMVHHGLKRPKGQTFVKKAGASALVISSYALLARDLELFHKMEWAGVMLDEAQNIKNPETKPAKAARDVQGGFRVVLTGTPVENHVGDIWSIMEFLNPGFLGSQADFRRRFFLPIQLNRDEESAERLKRLTGPFILRRLKTDKSIISDLPDKQEMKVFCHLTKEQASLYATVAAEAQSALSETKGIQRKGVILATLTKLKQVCNHPAQFLGDGSSLTGRSGKLTRLTEMQEEILEVGDRSLIFTQYAEMGELLKKHLQSQFGREVLFLHGGVPRPQRDRMVTRFQAEGDGPSTFILSLKAGGSGLNLTRANHVFHFDRWWNPAVENQATDRAFRIGQTKNVQVHKFVCAGTFEEQLDAMIAHKKDLAERIVGAGEGWLTELSNDELKHLFALRGGIVED